MPMWVLVLVDSGPMAEPRVVTGEIEPCRVERVDGVLELHGFESLEEARLLLMLDFAGRCERCAVAAAARAAPCARMGAARRGG